VKLKNTSGGSVDLPTLEPSRVADGEEIEVTGDDARNLLASGLFKRTDQPASKTDKE
jgi:hypothetical protein